MGRKALPTAVKKARGTNRPCRNRGEPVPGAGTPRKPTWVTGPAAKLWKSVVADLSDMGVATKVDTVVIGMLCIELAAYLKANELVQEHGIVCVTDRGNEIEHPAVGARGKSFDRIVKVAREFGMTPSARASLHITQSQPEEPEGKGRFFKIAG